MKVINRTSLAAVAALTLMLSSCAAEPTNSPSPMASATEAPLTQTLMAGPVNPEDLVAVPGTRMVIGSGMAPAAAAGGKAHGHLYMIDSETHELTEIWPERQHSVALEDDLYGDCPGPPDLTAAAPHGINIKEQKDGTSKLYVINHGSREAVEIFTLRPTAKSLDVTWSGCVLLPSGTYGNGVAPEPGGEGLYVTNYLDPKHLTESFEAMLAGKNTGNVLAWTKERGWTEVPGSASAGANGILVSPGGDALFVAQWGSRKITRLPLSGQGPNTVNVDINPDNLRWGSDGQLYFTGQNLTWDVFKACLAGDHVNCPTNGYSAFRMNPKTMEVSKFFSTTGNDFGQATVVLPVGNEYWVGSVQGDRIARIVPAQ